MDPEKPNGYAKEKTSIHQMLKKWKKFTVTPKGTSKSIKFLKRTLSFNHTPCSSNAVPKGSVAVSVGNEMKRFVIPTHYLHHRAFQVLLLDAEEEYGFEQEGLLRIPCEVPVFEGILQVAEKKKQSSEIASCSHPHDSMCR